MDAQADGDVNTVARANDRSVRRVAVVEESTAGRAAAAATARFARFNTNTTTTPATNQAADSTMMKSTSRSSQLVPPETGMGTETQRVSYSPTCRKTTGTSAPIAINELPLTSSAVRTPNSLAITPPMRAPTGIPRITRKR